MAPASTFGNRTKLTKITQALKNKEKGKRYQVSSAELFHQESSAPLIFGPEPCHKSCSYLIQSVIYLHSATEEE